MNNSTSEINSQLNSAVIFTAFARFFYVVTPKDNNYATLNDVPDYFNNSWPYFLLFILLENLVRFVQRKPLYRFNDSLTSLSHAIIQECGRLIFRSTQIFLYLGLYNNYRVVELPWKHWMTWYLAMIAIDFGYYWGHRASHEVHIIWAQHQVHHSSEEFNLTVGLRQSFFQQWCNFCFYLPLALVIPPTHFLAHQQLNLLYQFWIHTECVKNLGFLEYIFNTPKHHRLHHGSNIYCLDRNYGGVFIIWDRLFGTFREKHPIDDEDIIYGLVSQPATFNPLYLQMFYTSYVLNRLRTLKDLRLKLKVLFYGPSWQPGKPRLGLDKDKIHVKARDKYDIKLSFTWKLYLTMHFCIVALSMQILSGKNTNMEPIALLFSILYIIGSLTIQGMFLDKNPMAPHWELIRCLVSIIAIVWNFSTYRYVFYFLLLTWNVTSFMICVRAINTNN